MDEYPRNNQKKAHIPPSQKSENKVVKVEKVVTGDVVRRKRSLGARFKETFTGSNNQSVFDYIVFDTVVPYFKDMVVDAVTLGIERKVYGEARPINRRAGAGRQTVGGYVNYNKVSTQERPEPRGSGANRKRNGHNIDEILFQTRPEALEVIDRLAELVNEYGQASVSQFYDLVGVPANYIDERWGWMDLGNASATRIRDGYIVNLPRPEPLD